MPETADVELQSFLAPAAETARIIRSGTIWLAAAMVAAAAFLGPLLASGWRPAGLPLGAAIGFWAGCLGAAVGVGLLVWAGCPVLRSGFDQAHGRKVNSIRVGIPLCVAGLAIAAVAVMLSPA